MFAMPSLTSDLNSGARGSDRRGRLWSSVNGSGTHAGPAFQRASDPDAPLVDLDPFLTSRRVQLVTLAARHASPQDSQNDI
jgi:hypothetical protein